MTVGVSMTTQLLYVYPWQHGDCLRIHGKAVTLSVSMTTNDCLCTLDNSMTVVNHNTDNTMIVCGSMTTRWLYVYPWQHGECMLSHDRTVTFYVSMTTRWLLMYHNNTVTVCLFIHDNMANVCVSMTTQWLSEYPWQYSDFLCIHDNTVTVCISMTTQLLSLYPSQHDDCLCDPDRTVAVCLSLTTLWL